MNLGESLVPDVCSPKPNPIEIRKEHAWGKGWKIWGKNMLVFSLLDVPTQVVSYTFLPI